MFTDRAQDVLDLAEIDNVDLLNIFNTFPSEIMKFLKEQSLVILEK